MLYLSCCRIPFWQQKGGVLFGNSIFIPIFCYGMCDLSLHLQMARQKRQ